MPIEAISLQDKVAIVAGGGRGNGAAISKLLAEAGAAVAVVDIEPERAEGTAEAIRAAGGRALPVVAELREPEGVARIVAETRAAFGGIDVLANVAGGMNVYAAWRPMAEWTDEDWDMILARNLRYVFLICRAVIRAMLEQGRGGSIVNIASISGMFAAPNHAAYGAAKGGLISLTKSLAVEYGPHGIRVNAVAPGAILTPATANGMTPERQAGFKSLVPLGRVGQPEEIARAVLFFASDLASYVTGQTLLVDGGASVKFPLGTPAR